MIGIICYQGRDSMDEGYNIGIICYHGRDSMDEGYMIGIICYQGRDSMDEGEAEEGFTESREDQRESELSGKN